MPSASWQQETRAENRHYWKHTSLNAAECCCKANWSEHHGASHHSKDRAGESQRCPPLLSFLLFSLNFQNHKGNVTLRKQAKSVFAARKAEKQLKKKKKKNRIINTTCRKKIDLFTFLFFVLFAFCQAVAEWRQTPAAATKEQTEKTWRE